MLYFFLGILSVLLLHLGLRRLAAMPPARVRHVGAWTVTGGIAMLAAFMPRLGKWLLLGWLLKPRGDAAGRSGAGSRPSDTPMDAQEAREILGVTPNAEAQEIERAYRKLIRHHHPDKEGGSRYFASKLNQARDVLLSKAEKSPRS